MSERVIVDIDGDDCNRFSVHDGSACCHLTPADNKVLHVGHYTGEDNSSSVPPEPQHLIRAWPVATNMAVEARRLDLEGSPLSHRDISTCDALTTATRKSSNYLMTPDISLDTRRSAADFFWLERSSLFKSHQFVGNDLGLLRPNTV